MHEAGGSCLCTHRLEDLPAITADVGAALPTITRLRAAMTIGAPSPDAVHGGGYRVCKTKLCTSRPGVRVWTRWSQLLNADSIFEFTGAKQHDRPSSKRQPRFLLNRVVAVTVGADNEQGKGAARGLYFRFRNPPHFVANAGDLGRRLRVYQVCGLF